MALKARRIGEGEFLVEHAGVTYTVRCGAGFQGWRVELGREVLATERTMKAAKAWIEGRTAPPLVDRGGVVEKAPEAPKLAATFRADYVGRNGSGEAGVKHLSKPFHAMAVTAEEAQAITVALCRHFGVEVPRTFWNHRAARLNWGFYKWRAKEVYVRRQAMTAGVVVHEVAHHLDHVLAAKRGALAELAVMERPHGRSFKALLARAYREVVYPGFGLDAGNAHRIAAEQHAQAMKVNPGARAAAIDRSMRRIPSGTRVRVRFRNGRRLPGTIVRFNRTRYTVRLDDGRVCYAGSRFLGLV